MAEKTKRIEFRLSEVEFTQIQNKMQEMGTQNMSAYLRKMALDGYRCKGAGAASAHMQQQLKPVRQGCQYLRHRISGGHDSSRHQAGRAMDNGKGNHVYTCGAGIAVPHPCASVSALLQ